MDVSWLSLESESLLTSRPFGLVSTAPVPDFLLLTK
jgi:hypothetical protein